MSRESAARLFELTGLSVEQRIAYIDRTALDLIKFRDAPKDAAVRRWALRQLNLCSETFCEPAPQGLIALISAIVAVSEKPRGRVRNLEKWQAAADHMAHHPDATASAIRTAIQYDQLKQIKTWMQSDEFRRQVELRRFVLDFEG